MKLLFTPDETYRNGVVDYFARKNIIDDHMFAVSSSVYGSLYMPHNLLTIGNDFFHSNSTDDDDEFVIIGLKHSTISLTSYSLRSSVNGVQMLVSWELHASTDLTKWTLIDSRSSQNELVETNVVLSYDCKQGEYKYFMMKNCRSHSNEKYIVFSQLEFFGTLTFDKILLPTCKIMPKISIYIILYTTIVL